jgi:3-phosphoshikimate 1-carboxyvinyltransferase
MALSLAGLAIEGKCTIDRAEAMSVTFPGYVELMRGIGGEMEMVG